MHRVPRLLNYLGFFVAPDRGLLVWSPVLLLLAPAIARTWRTTPDWTRWLAVGGLVYTFVQLRLNYFAGGDFFYGYRHGLELVTCLVPVAAVAYERSSRRTQVAICVLVVLQFAAISLGAVTDEFAAAPGVRVDGQRVLGGAALEPGGGPAVDGTLLCGRGRGDAGVPRIPRQARAGWADAGVTPPAATARTRSGRGTT